MALSKEQMIQLATGRKTCAERNEAVVLDYLSGMKAARIAEKHNLSKQYVSVILTNARKAAREALKG